MAATIMMPSGFDDAIRSMCLDAVNQAVAVLATKYGFDAEEAARDVSELKLARKRGPSPKKEKEKKVKAKAKASGKPKTKRPKTGYLLYQAETRPEVVAALTEELAEGAKLQGKDVISVIAAKWAKIKGTPEEEEWKKRAKDAATPEHSEEEEEVVPPLRVALQAQEDAAKAKVELGEELDCASDDEGICAFSDDEEEEDELLKDLEEVSDDEE